MPLTSQQRTDVAAQIADDLSRLNEPIGVNKAALLAAVAAADDTIEANFVALLASLPEPAQSGMTVEQKRRVFSTVVTRRFELGA